MSFLDVSYTAETLFTPPLSSIFGLAANKYHVSKPALVLLLSLEYPMTYQPRTQTAFILPGQLCLSVYNSACVLI